MFIIILSKIVGTVNSTSDYTLWTLYLSYFKGISANIELQVYGVTCCDRNLNSELQVNQINEMEKGICVSGIFYNYK
jgi:hypothetical protein